MDRGFLTHDEKELIFSFWMSNTCVSPNKKDVCRKCIGIKSYVKHPVHLLEQSQVITCFTISIFVFFVSKIYLLLSRTEYRFNIFVYIFLHIQYLSTLNLGPNTDPPYFHL